MSRKSVTLIIAILVIAGSLMVFAPAMADNAIDLKVESVQKFSNGRKPLAEAGTTGAGSAYVIECVAKSSCCRGVKTIITAPTDRNGPYVTAAGLSKGTTHTALQRDFVEIGWVWDTDDARPHLLFFWAENGSGEIWRYGYLSNGGNYELQITRVGLSNTFRCYINGTLVAEHAFRGATYLRYAYTWAARNASAGTNNNNTWYNVKWLIGGAGAWTNVPIANTTYNNDPSYKMTAGEGWIRFKSR